MTTRFGELLVSEGRISPAILRRALELQGTREKGLRLGGILLKWGLVEEQEILEMLGRIHRCPCVGWKVLAAADPEVVNLLTPAQAKRLGALPYAVEDRWLQVAFVNPSDLAAIDEVTAIANMRVRAAVAIEVRLLQAHLQFYGRSVSPGVGAVLRRLDHMSRKLVSTAPKMPDRDASSGTAPPPDFSAHEDWEALLSLAATPDPETLVAQVPEQLDSPAEAHGLPEDPFSDDFPLERFIADAIELFNGLPNSLSDISDEPVENLDPSMVEITFQPSAAASDPKANTS